MLSIGLISLVVAIPVLSYRITPNKYYRITFVVIIYSALLAFTGIHFESLASGIGIYNPLEDNNNFIASINQSILNWIETHYTERVPINNSDNNSINNHFIIANFVVIIIYTIVYYFIILCFTHFIINYYVIKILSTDSYPATFTSNSIAASSIYQIIITNIFKFITVLVEFIIYINKIIIVILYIIIIISITYLYYFNLIPSDIINNIINNINVLNTNYLYSLNGIPVQEIRDFIEIILIILIILYRFQKAIDPFNLGPYFAFIVIQPIAYILIYTAKYMNNIVITTSYFNNHTCTLIEVINAYNSSIKTVFYSIIIVGGAQLITFTIEYIISNKIDSSNNKFTFKNITVSFVKIISSLAFYCLFLGIISLYGYYIPSQVSNFLL